MLTGPHADHTTGQPFQGNYMVINTNTEVFTKRARLLSPLYKTSAKTLCFKFYYHMYGVNLGTLRVYVKPESVEMQDVLLEDMESEARNDFVVFEIKGMSGGGKNLLDFEFCKSNKIFLAGSQGNSWQEGGGFLKPVNESFQV